MASLLTCKDLHLIVEELKEVVDWMSFGIHLPGIEMYVLEQIRYDNLGAEGSLCKLKLFSTWLEKCPNASWTHICYCSQENREV